MGSLVALYFDWSSSVLVVVVNGYLLSLSSKKECCERGKRSRGGEDETDPSVLQALLEDEVSNFNATTMAKANEGGSHHKTQSLWEIPTGGSTKWPPSSFPFPNQRSGLESISGDVMMEAQLVRDSWQK